jgi:hypothetical protein
MLLALFVGPIFSSPAGNLMTMPNGTVQPIGARRRRAKSNAPGGRLQRLTPSLKVEFTGRRPGCELSFAGPTVHDF